MLILKGTSFFLPQLYITILPFTTRMLELGLLHQNFLRTCISHIYPLYLLYHCLMATTSNRLTRYSDDESSLCDETEHGKNDDH